jgi:hypothetical protein
MARTIPFSRPVRPPLETRYVVPMSEAQYQAFLPSQPHTAVCPCISPARLIDVSPENDDRSKLE